MLYNHFYFKLSWEKSVTVISVFLENELLFNNMKVSEYIKYINAFEKNM